MLQTAENKKQFLIRYKASACNISQACDAIHITRQTFYNWKDADEQFEHDVKEIDLSMIENVESQLMKNILNGKEISLIFFLTNKDSENWKHKNAQVNVDNRTLIQNFNSAEIADKIKRIYGEDTPKVAKRIADALGIKLESDTTTAS